ncbi:AEC family transporter [Bifidobacterium bombi]|uniref:AEC family transporter n=1 Tax=Bifidobacterium bombi TaxID=471511 RepID=UPI001269C2B7|nr:AEC family transporter [Bifidobacterium bombi]
MDVLITPMTLMLILAAGYLLKHLRVFGATDYRVVQAIEFDLVLPGAIVHSFATNDHSLSLLWISLFSLAATLVPPLLIYLTTTHTPVSDRAFMMLNSTGFNVGCFCFPMVQALVGPQGLVATAMFDIGNNIMVAAGTNVLTQQLLDIPPGKTLTQQEGASCRKDDAAWNDGRKPHHEVENDPGIRRLHRRALAKSIAWGFLSSPSFDTYIVMVVLMVADVHLPHWMAQVSQPFSGANAFCSMLMVGMLTELPSNRHDVASVCKVLGWRLPCAVLAALIAWFLLPFGTAIRESVVLCCFAPIAVFSTMFTDKVLGNAKLAGFSLSVTAVISTVLMVVVHLAIHM